MKLVPCTTAQEVARLAAEQVAALLEQDAAPVLIVPAGRTPLALFAELVRRHRARELDLARAHIFQLDELVGVGPRDSRSFQHLLREHLLGPAGLADGRLALLDGCTRDPAREIVSHAQRLADLGGGDLALLGLGRNGHVAFNEPGSTHAAGARVTDLAPLTRGLMHDAFDPEAVPSTGLTLGIAELHACARVTLLVTGASKAEPLAALVAGPSEPALPASLFKGHAGFSVLADAPARSRVAQHPTVRVD